MNALSLLVCGRWTKAVGALTSLAVVAFLTLSGGADAARAEGPAVLNRGNSASLNPQPLPPRYLSLSKYRTLGKWYLGDTVALNPQPLPPKAVTAKNLPRPGDPVLLNPQPLPPKAKVLLPLLQVR